MAKTLSREVWGPRVFCEAPTRHIRELRNLDITMDDSGGRDYNYLSEDGTNSGGRSEETRVLIEDVFSAALASELGNPAGF